jgi:hypothetical protein
MAQNTILNTAQRKCQSTSDRSTTVCYFEAFDLSVITAAIMVTEKINATETVDTEIAAMG